MTSTRQAAEPRRSGRDLWRRGRNARDHLDDVLVTGARLPLRYWRPLMFFHGAPDETLAILTDGGFPGRLVPGKAHPVISLEALPDGVGFRACPCSSARPRLPGRHRFIRRGCLLGATGHEMDRDSFLVEAFRFNIPADVAYALRFRGEVPEDCIARVALPVAGPTAGPEEGIP